MKNYDEKLFVGNIMQRTEDEKVVNEEPLKTTEVTDCWLVKENAVLYKTQNGGFVDVDVLNLDGLFAPFRTNAVDKVEIETSSKKTSSGISVLPAISLADVEKPTKEWGYSGVLGQFVDADSLVSYVEFKNAQAVEENGITR